jgi:Zn-dependent protease
MSATDTRADEGMPTPDLPENANVPVEVFPEPTIDEISDSVRPAGAKAEAWRDETLEAVTQLSIPQEVSHPSLGLTAISMLLFVVTLGFWLGWAQTPFIVAIILIHEAGHLVAKKAFGYTDLQLFFIPFIGAAVSGRKDNASQVERAIVALAGPVPSSLVASAYLYMYYNGLLGPQPELLHQVAYFTLLINCFNLIPLVPLDGGQFFTALFFSRRPWMETACKLVAVAALLVIGIGSAWASIAIAAMILMSVRASHNISVLSRRLRFAELNTDASLEEMPLERLIKAYALTYDLVPESADPMLERRVTLRVGLLQRAYPGALARPAPPQWVAALLALYILVSGFGGYVYWQHEQLKKAEQEARQELIDQTAAEKQVPAANLNNTPDD